MEVLRPNFVQLVVAVLMVRVFEEFDKLVVAVLVVRVFEEFDKLVVGQEAVVEVVDLVLLALFVA